MLSQTNKCTVDEDAPSSKICITLEFDYLIYIATYKVYHLNKERLDVEKEPAWLSVFAALIT